MRAAGPGRQQAEPAAIVRALGRPEPFAPHDAPFWDDPWIAARMLEAHLDPATDAASRRPETIARTVAHLATAMGIGDGARLVDLGCGPGLYALPVARLGAAVTGIDLSAGSIGHARAAAAAEGLHIAYRVADYTREPLGGPYDAAILVYLDLGVLGDAARDRLLDGVRSALAPGAAFAFDVHGLARPRPPDGHLEVFERDGGFWRPGPHVVVETTYRYGRDLDLAQHAVFEPDGRVTAYRVWDRAYGPAELRRLLRRHGLGVEAAWSDLAGTPWHRRSPELGVLARRR